MRVLRSSSKTFTSDLAEFCRGAVVPKELQESVAAILAGMDVLEREPERQAQLMDNARLVAAGLRRLGFSVSPDSAIFSLPVPLSMNIRPMAFAFHQRGLFLNHIEFPAVKPSAQRFRISVMANHTREDLDRLLTAIEEVWATQLLGDGQAGAPHHEVRRAE